MTVAISERYGVDLDTPWQDLPQDQRDFFMFGTGEKGLQRTYRNRFGRRRSYTTNFEGILSSLQRRVQGDRLRVDAREDRGVHDVAAVSRMLGRATATGVPGGAGRRNTNSQDFTGFSVGRAPS